MTTDVHNSVLRASSFFHKTEDRSFDCDELVIRSGSRVYGISHGQEVKSLCGDEKNNFVCRIEVVNLGRKKTTDTLFD